MSLSANSDLSAIRSKAAAPAAAGESRAERTRIHIARATRGAKNRTPRKDSGRLRLFSGLDRKESTRCPTGILAWTNGMSSSAWPVIPARSAGCPSTSLIGHVRWHALGISGSSPEIVPTETCLWAGSPLRQGTMAGPTGSARKRAFFALGAAGRFSIRQGPSPEAKPHCRIAAGSVLGSHACVALSPEPASLLYRLPVADKAINATFPEACLSMSAKFSYSGGITPGAVQFREKSQKS